MNIYFVIICVLFALSLGITLSRNGEYTYDKYDFKVSLFAILIELFLIYNAIMVGF